MTDKPELIKREPIERYPRPIHLLSKPSASKVNIPFSKTPTDVQKLDLSSSEHKSTTKRFRKRRRIRYPKNSFDVEMSKLPGNDVMRGENRTPVEMATSGYVDEPESQHAPASSSASSLGEAVPEVGALPVEAEYATNTISPTADHVSMDLSTPEDDDSGSNGFVQEVIVNTLANSATDALRPIIRRSARCEPCECPPTPEAALPVPVTSPAGHQNKDVIRVNSSFIRLNFALLSVLVHISTQINPSTSLSGPALLRMLAALNSGTLFFPLCIFVLFDPSSSKVSKWARNARLQLNTFWIRMWSLIFMLIIKILLVVEVFQHLPLWIGVFLLVVAVAAFVPFLVVVLVMNLLRENNNSQVNEKSLRVVINMVYGSLIFVHILEMRPSLLNAIIVAAAPSNMPTPPLLSIGSLCFNLAIILQLPALFLEASCVDFCNCVVGRKGNSAGVASLLLTVLFQSSLSSFLAAIGVTMVANGVSTLGFCLYVGMASIFMVIVGCYQLDILPLTSLVVRKQRVE